MTLTDLCDHSFITFAERVIAQSMVTPALQRLYEQHSLNKNSILYALWFAVECHGRLRKSQLQQLSVAVLHWHERITVELERLKATLTDYQATSTHELTQSIRGDVELADVIEKRLLLDAIGACAIVKRSQLQSINDACQNMVNLCKQQKINVDIADRQAMLIILQASFDGASAVDVSECFEKALEVANFDSTACQQTLL